MKQCKNNANTLTINILFICVIFITNKKPSSAINWKFRRTFMFVGVTDEGKFLNVALDDDAAKIIKFSLHLQRITTKNILIWKTLEWCRG